MWGAMWLQEVYRHMQGYAGVYRNATRGIRFCSLGHIGVIGYIGIAQQAAGR